MERGVLPMIRERWLALQELGVGLGRIGGVEGLIKQSNGSAVGFVSALVQASPRWRDVRNRGDIEIQFAKRAQLCAAIVHKSGFCSFSDVDRLTVFSDYRLPQLLRSEGVIHFSQSLADKVAASQELQPNSEEEVEIRAATLVAAEVVRKAAEDVLARRLSAAELDYFLWR